MRQLNLFWDNPLREDWYNFRREVGWAGWIIIVKLIADPQFNDCPYEWTATCGSGVNEVKITDPTSHQTLNEAIEHAKSAIINYEEGYINH